MGSVTFDYGNNIRTFAFSRGVKNAYDFPGFVPAYIRPLFCEGRGALPLGWRSRAIPRISRRPTIWCWRCSRKTTFSTAGSGWPRKRIRFQGLPARICWLGYGERDRFALAMNAMVKMAG